MGDQAVSRISVELDRVLGLSQGFLVGVGFLVWVRLLVGTTRVQVTVTIGLLK